MPAIRERSQKLVPIRELDRTARVFHALADPIRLAVVEQLRNGERCVCELTAVLDAEQSRLSFHLRVLKDAGILLDRKEGRWVHYRLNHERLSELAGLLSTATAPARLLKPWISKTCCANLTT